MTAAEVFRQLHPEQFLERFLSQDVRPDGRALLHGRRTTVNVGSIGSAAGSATVRIGHTTVICGVVAELCVPKLDTPKKGIVVANVELTSMCAAKYRPGPPPEDSQVLSVLLADTLKHVIPLENLVIEDGQLAWCLYVDCVCIDHDGNVSDAAVLAAVAALRSTVLPIVEFRNDTAVRVSGTIALTLSPVEPYCSTFVIFASGKLCFDPTAEEEALAVGKLIIAVPAVKKCSSIFVLDKIGGPAIAEAVLRECIGRARSRAEECFSVVNLALQ